MNPRVKSVTPQQNHKLLLHFTHGEQGVYDCTGLLNFGVFTELQDENYFRQVTTLDGTIVWPHEQPHEQDTCPDTLYLDSVKISPRKAQ